MCELPLARGRSGDFEGAFESEKQEKEVFMVLKKVWALAAAMALSAFMLASCASGGASAPSAGSEEGASAEAAAPVDVRAVALKGPTAMGLVKFMDQVDKSETADNNYSFDIAASVDEVVPKIAKGEVDIAAVPANLASVLYNNTNGEVRVLAINTLGVLYICETGNSVQTAADLKGKTIYASGKGATPEYALSYILENNGLVPGQDVTVEWKSEHAECIAAMAQNPDAIAMLPQPFVAAAQAKNTDIRIALDLTKEWDALQKDASAPSALVTGVVVARASFIEENPQAVQAFMEHYRESVDFVNANVDQAAALVGSYDIVSEGVAKKALPGCNIVFLSGSDMKNKLSGYLNVLSQQNPQSVGGSLPVDEFYYGA